MECQVLQITPDAKNLEHLNVPFTNLVVATNNFAKTHLIGSGAYGEVYKGELELPEENKNKNDISKRRRTVAIKRILIRKEDKQGIEGFKAEILLLTSCKHGNIISLLGFCYEGTHMILVYEYASNGSLDAYLRNTNKFNNLTWEQRIKICVDIAHGLNYLHTRKEIEQRIIHRDIKSGNILLGPNLEAKISDFGLSRLFPNRTENTYYTYNIAGTEPYLDPEYAATGKLNKGIDIYSFGVVLFELLYGKIATDQIFRNEGLAHCAQRRFKEVWESTMRKPIPFAVRSSMKLGQRSDLVKFKPTFPSLLKLSRQGRDRASEFSYINDRSSHEWQSIPESKFKKVVEVLDTTNLMIKIELRTDLLSPNVTYGVRLLFKFRDPRKVSSKPAYVNLKYKKGNETVHAYFATWRDDNWMTVELCRFLNHKEVKHDEIEQKIDVQQVIKEPDMKVDQVQQLLINYDKGEKLFWLTDMNGKKHLMLLAEAALHDFANVKLFTSKLSADSRFQEVFELLPQQVLRINCAIKSHMLSPDTEYVCYLLFKLTEQCDGLHCPVKVRDLLQKKIEEAGIVYCISPSLWNVHDFIKTPTQRGDGWMEENHKDKLQISLEDISKATQNFDDANLIGQGPVFKVYEGRVAHGCNIIAVKRLGTSHGDQRDYDFATELEILYEHKHENIVGLVGYCNEEKEKIIVCEYAHNGSLDKHLNHISVTWIKRLNICIDVASGLAFLHKGSPTKEMVIHNDIQSANILLTDEWKAKITDFGLSIIPIDGEIMYHQRAGGCVDPLHESTGFITKESDIYAFGVMLYEVLSGRRIVTDKHKYDRQNLTAIKDIVFKDIERYVAPESLNTFRKIASQCIDDVREKRPTAEQVLGQLKEALEIQEGYDIWEPKLPKDYTELIQTSKSPEIYYKKTKNELYDIFFTEGILLKKDTVVAWKKICRPKSQGGLRLKDLGVSNKAMIVKHLWHVIIHRDSLWVKWICTVKLKDEVRSSIVMNIGNGEKTFMIYDNWCGDGILQSFITHRDLYNVTRNDSMVVKDIVENGVCMWPEERITKYPDLPLHNKIGLNADKEDTTVWRAKNGKKEGFLLNKHTNTTTKQVYSDRFFRRKSVGNGCFQQISDRNRLSDFSWSLIFISRNSVGNNDRICSSQIRHIFQSEKRQK
nr:protein kinase-like domain, phloem protein 2-like protein [Tanacetum cinerariifolium]